jgi:hypothetical protein
MDIAAKTSAKADQELFNHWIVKEHAFRLQRGDIAQLARAPALQAGGPGFESLCLHQVKCKVYGITVKYTF